MMRRKFNNINYVFIMLSSVRADGSYAPSGDIANVTTVLQYMFRIILLQQAMREADEPNADQERKTTSLTGKDRLDVHALPPKISEMLLIFNTIVRPVAVQWLKELDNDDPDVVYPDVDEDEDYESFEGCESYNDEDTDSEYEDPTPNTKRKRSKSPTPRYKPIVPPNTPRYIVQDELTFSKSGKPFTSDDLSRLFRSFSETHIGLALGIQAWRHIQEVIQRDVLGYSFEESEDYEDTFFHLQAGHTAKIAALFYAVTDGDRTLEASESIIKYITASRAMQAWLDGEPLPPIPG
ncbi:hypothetical protein RSOL_175580, partial [Rhizoctonia solani AG-3 Rhs1AP]